jgi:hypothetical protein
MIRRHTLSTAQRQWVAVVLCVSVILLASEAFAAGFVAQAVKTRGDIRITRDGGDMSCSMGTALQLGDVIKTGPGARLRLRFVDGSILALGENTTLSVDLFAVDAANKSRTVVLTVLEGIVNAAAAKSGESKFDYQIKTANGYSAVRGTKWIVAFQQALMTVYVLNGQVEVGIEGGTAGAMVNAGQWGSVDAGGAISPVQPTTPELLKPVLDATSDTAMNTVPPSNTVPSQPLIPLPQITPQQQQPSGPIRAEKGNNTGGGGGGGGGGGKTGGSYSN